jgi:hypothetical protein
MLSLNNASELSIVQNAMNPQDPKEKADEH